MRIAIALLFGMFIAGCGGSGSGGGNVTVSGDQVTVVTQDLDVVLTKGAAMSDTFMIFGGLSSDAANLVNPVTITGLKLSDAMEIYAQYPDFHKCASPGAEYAKPLIKQLNLIPADGGTLQHGGFKLFHSR